MREITSPSSLHSKAINFIQQWEATSVVNEVAKKARILILNADEMKFICVSEACYTSTTNALAGIGFSNFNITFEAIGLAGNHDPEEYIPLILIDRMIGITAVNLLKMKD